MSAASISFHSIAATLIKEREPAEIYAQYVEASSGTNLNSCAPELMAVRRMLLRRYAVEAVSTLGRLAKRPALVNVPEEIAFRFLGCGGGVVLSFLGAVQEFLFDCFCDEEPTRKARTLPSTQAEAIRLLRPWIRGSERSRMRFVTNAFGNGGSYFATDLATMAKQNGGAVGTRAEMKKICAAVGRAVFAIARDDPLLFVHAVRGGALLAHALPNTPPRQMKSMMISPDAHSHTAVHPLTKAVYRLSDSVSIAIARGAQIRDRAVRGQTAEEFCNVSNGSSTRSEKTKRSVDGFVELSARATHYAVGRCFWALRKPEFVAGLRGAGADALTPQAGWVLRAVCDEAVLLAADPDGPECIRGNQHRAHGSHSRRDDDGVESPEDGGINAAIAQAISEHSDGNQDGARTFAEPAKRDDGRRKRVGREAAAGDGFVAGGASDLFSSKLFSATPGSLPSCRTIHRAGADLEKVAGARMAMVDEWREAQASNPEQAASNLLHEWMSLPLDAPRRERHAAFARRGVELKRLFIWGGSSDINNDEIARSRYNTTVGVMSRLARSSGTSARCVENWIDDVITSPRIPFPFGGLILICSMIAQEFKQVKNPAMLELLSIAGSLINQPFEDITGTSWSPKSVTRFVDAVYRNSECDVPLQVWQLITGLTALAKHATNPSRRDETMRRLSKTASATQTVEEMLRESFLQITQMLMNACVAVTNVQSKHFGDGNGPLLAKGGGVMSCSLTILNALAVLSRASSPQIVELFGHIFHVWTADEMMAARGGEPWDLLLPMKSRSRKLMLDEGVLAFFAAAIHPDVQSRQFRCTPEEAAQDPGRVRAWAVGLIGAFESVYHLAALHPALMMGFGFHTSALTILNGYAANVQQRTVPRGTRVVLRDLVGASELNGLMGTILAWIVPKQRYKVQIIARRPGETNSSGGKTVALKPGNLRRLCHPLPAHRTAAAVSRHDLLGEMPVLPITAPGSAAGASPSNRHHPCCTLIETHIKDNDISIHSVRDSGSDRDRLANLAAILVSNLCRVTSDDSVPLWLIQSGVVRTLAHVVTARAGSFGDGPLVLSYSAAGVINQSLVGIYALCDAAKRTGCLGAMHAELRSLDRGEDNFAFSATVRRLIRDLESDGGSVVVGDPQVSILRHTMSVLIALNDAVESAEPSAENAAIVAADIDASVACAMSIFASGSVKSSSFYRTSQITDVPTLNNAATVCSMGIVARGVAMHEVMKRCNIPVAGSTNAPNLHSFDDAHEALSMIIFGMRHEGFQQLPCYRNFASVVSMLTKHPDELAAISFQRTKEENTPKGARGSCLHDTGGGTDSATGFGMRCENCGIAEVAPGAELSWCQRCKLVCYCSVECQSTQWPTHKKQCASAKKKKKKKKKKKAST